jgi:hypothetical protein
MRVGAWRTSPSYVGVRRVRPSLYDVLVHVCELVDVVVPLGRHALVHFAKDLKIT